MRDSRPPGRRGAYRRGPPAVFLTPRCRLFLGDAAEILRYFAKASIDCVVTSPPYYRSRRYRRIHRKEIGLEKTVDDYVGRLSEVGREILRVLRPRGSFWFVIGDTRQRGEWLGVPWRVAFALRDIGWMIRNVFIWHEAGPTTKRSRHRPESAHTVVFHFAKSARAYTRSQAVRKVPFRTDVWTFSAEEPNPGFHFSVLPQALVERAVRTTCPARGIVMDPFVGSGTTLVAALQLGRSAVGIELSEDYVEIARKRITKVR